MSVLDQVLSSDPKLAERQSRIAPPGRLARLNNGVTYYELGGTSTGKQLVLINGFSVPNFIWDPTFAALVAAGFNVLRYDLFGRGLSDRPKIDYDKALYVSQLAELMDIVEFETADLISLSMGGVIAAEFVYRFPKRVGRLAFIDPAGFDLELPWTFKPLWIPGLGEFALGVLGRFGSGTLLESMLADFYEADEETAKAFSTRYLEQMQYGGFIHSLLSSLRTGMLDEDLQLFRRVAELGKPVLLIWGKEDRTVPFHNSAKFMKLVPQAEFHSIDLARHIPHFERPEVVNPILISFLK